MKNPKIEICRIVKLDNHHGCIVGQDLGNILKDGMVYEVGKLMDEYIIRSIGKSAHVMVANKQYPSFKSDPRKKSQILMDGTTYITEEEYKAEKHHHESEY